MRVNLMIEGQESVTWPQWLALASATEQAGLEGLFRSDHYQSVQGRTERSSLDAWSTIAALGAVTERIRLGTMVSPTSFRHPSVLAKQVVTADHVSGGRVELGIGAGWHGLEHRTYGFPFHDLGVRYDVFEEQLAIIHNQMTQEAFDHDGKHYELDNCEARPKPVQAPRVPFILGGQAGPRASRLAATYADEYNTTFPSPDVVRERKANVDAACEAAGRAPIAFSIMTGCIVGRDEAEAKDRGRTLHQHSKADKPFEPWWESLQGEWVTGSLDQAASRLAEFQDAGATRIFLQHQLHDDLEMVQVVGELGRQVG